MSDFVLTLNAGSSSIKFSLAQAEAGGAVIRAAGEVEGLGGQPRLKFSGRAPLPLSAGQARDHEAALHVCLELIEREFPGARIRAIGHRVVHGGPRFDRPVAIDDAILAELARLAPWAPLHQPHNVAGIRAARAAFPEAPQIACFDTAFHRGHDFVNDAYGLPRALYDAGVRRYGFHGLSYEYIAARLAEIAPDIAAGRVIVAHLGNGASLCAMRGGRSVASTMGFSTLDGLAMGTRPGQLDPGVILYLLQSQGHDANSLTELLYKQSGLKGISTISNDMRELEASSDPRAAEAIAYFAHRVRYEIGGLTATLGGLDALAFSGGIGEHSSTLRAAVVEGLGWLGLRLDEAANAAHGSRIDAAGSAIPVFVVPTNEELRIAQHALAFVAAR